MQSGGAAVAVELARRRSHRPGEGVEHQVPADQAGIGQAVGEAAGGELSRSAACRRRCRRGSTTCAGWKYSAPVGVVVDAPVAMPCVIGGDLAHPAVRAQLHAGADRGGPVGDVGAGLGALGAARGAVAEVDAGRAALVIRRGDRGVGRPPVPAQPVHRLASACRTAERQRRHRRVSRRRAGVAGQAGDADHAVVLGEERLQRVVVHRPVVGHAVQRAHRKSEGCRRGKCPV